MKTFSITLSTEDANIILESIDSTIQCELDAVDCYPEAADQFKKNSDFWILLKKELSEAIANDET